MLLEQRTGQNWALVPTEHGSRPASIRRRRSSSSIFYTQNRARYMVAERRVLRPRQDQPRDGRQRHPNRCGDRGLLQANQATYGGNETGGRPGGGARQTAGRRNCRPRSFGGQLRGGRRACRPFGRGCQRRTANSHGVHFPGRSRRRQRRFRRGKGAVVGPVRSDLGWHVIKIDDVRAATGKSLAEVRGEIERSSRPPSARKR